MGGGAPGGPAAAMARTRGGRRVCARALRAPRALWPRVRAQCHPSIATVRCVRHFVLGAPLWAGAHSACARPPGRPRRVAGTMRLALATARTASARRGAGAGRCSMCLLLLLLPLIMAAGPGAGSRPCAAMPGGVQICRCVHLARALVCVRWLMDAQISVLPEQ